MLEELVFQIEKYRIQKNHKSRTIQNSTENINLSNHSNYIVWRDTTLKQEFLSGFDVEAIEDRDVLDFGCGTGGLSFLLSALGAKSVIGVDLVESNLVAARNRLQGENIKFELVEDSEAIDAEDESFDVIACFDVMEHIISYESIIKEWHRVLRHGGKVLIYWQPYYHPYGHHAYTYIKVPWIHVFLSEEACTRLCARIVDLPEFDAPFWDRDENGNKINRFKNHSGDDSFLNKLTMRKFEKIVQQQGFVITKRNLIHFTGSQLVRSISKAITKLPVLREYFTACAIYILSKQ